MGQKPEQARKIRETNRKAGLCACGNDRIQGLLICPRCQQFNRDNYAKVRNACIAAYGGKCAGCGEPDLAVLLVSPCDSATPHRTYRKLISEGFPSGYRVLCGNCDVRATRGVPFPKPKSARKCGVNP